MPSTAFVARDFERVLVSAKISDCPPSCTHCTPKSIGVPRIVLATSNVVPSFIVTIPPSYTPSVSGTGLQSFSTNVHPSQSATSLELVMVALRPNICGLCSSLFS